MEMNELENIAPVLHREEITSSQREKVQQMKRMANRICRNSIPSDYINKSFNKFKQGYVYRDAEGFIIGFCIWTVKKINSKFDGSDRYILFVHLICGLPTQTKLYVCNRMFPDLETYCKDNNIEAIQLEPANQSLQTYYQSYGFEMTDTYLHIMTKKVSFPLSSSYTRGKTRKIKKNTSLLILPPINAEEV